MSEDTHNIALEALLTAKACDKRQDEILSYIKDMSSQIANMNQTFAEQRGAGKLMRIVIAILALFGGVAGGAAHSAVFK